MSEQHTELAADEQTKQQTKKARKIKKTLPPLSRKAISAEGFVALGILFAMFIPIGVIMGFSNMLQTIFNNALNLLTNTCFFLLGIAVVIGALSSVLTEFGAISLLNKALSPLMKPIYGMPGATSMAILGCFMSDNPATLSLANDRRYRRYF